MTTTTTTTTTTQFATVPPKVPRDDWERPLITPPQGGKPTAYTRVTTYIDVLDDKYLLNRWRQRNVVLGLVERPDLLLSAAAHRDQKDVLNKIVDEAVEAAKAHAAQNVGTAIHKLAETHDRGQQVGTMPAAYRADLDAYIKATAALELLAVEEFLVCDELKVAGTPDRIVRFDGTNYIADIKTGDTAPDGELSDFGKLKIAMQLAVYANSLKYDVTTGARSPLPAVNGQRAIIIHLPAGVGRCELHWVNIAVGWQAVQTATEVRTWRRQKNLTSPVTTVGPRSVIDAALPDDPILTAIGKADTVPALTLAWSLNQAAWTDEHTAAAAARKDVLTQTG